MLVDKFLDVGETKWREFAIENTILRLELTAKDVDDPNEEEKEVLLNILSDGSGVMVIAPPNSDDEDEMMAFVIRDCTKMCLKKEEVVH